MATISVSNTSELSSAIRLAKGGDTIELKGGNYGRLEISNIDFPQSVTIISDDNVNPAVFEYVNLNRVSNVTFDGVEFVKGNASGDSGKPFYFKNTSDVTIRNATIEGETDSGYGREHGLWVVSSDNFTLENSILRDFNVAAYFQNLSNLVVRNNSFSNIAHDAIAVGAVEGAHLEGNHIELHVRAGVKHTDAIQFWTTSTTGPSSDVVVRDNVILTNNAASHGIFGGNYLARQLGSQAAYKNFIIEDNVVVGGQVSGINIGETRGLTIRNNTLLQDVAVQDDSLIHIPTIRVDYESTGVSIIGNITHRVPLATDDRFIDAKMTPSDWTISSNRIVPLGTPRPSPNEPTDRDDVLRGTDSDDMLSGGAGDDTLFGKAGNDTLNGGPGADSMSGGAGDDRYFVDNVLDTVTEITDGGNDLVSTVLAAYTAPLHIENVTYTGSGVFLGTGNDLNNHMTGGAGADTLVGLDGNDILNGAAGSDTLVGDGGNDTLDGALGADSMRGGDGNDIYIVDDVGDKVMETARAGTDTVQTKLVLFALGSNVENLTLNGASAIGTGNELANIIIGGAGNDKLSGLAGADTLNGSNGQDLLSGGRGADVLNGGAGADIIIGGSGADAIDTGAANDDIVDRVRYAAAREFGDAVVNFDATGTGDRVEFGGALKDAWDDIVENDSFHFASSNGAAGAVSANLNTRHEALYLTGGKGEGVTTNYLGNAAAVATAFNKEFAITARTGEDAFLVVNDTNGNSFSAWHWVQAGGGEISAAELTLVGTFASNATVTATSFDFF